MVLRSDEHLIPVEAYETVEEAYKGIMENMTKLQSAETFACNQEALSSIHFVINEFVNGLVLSV